MGAKIFPKPTIHLKILRTTKVAWSKFQTEHPQRKDATVGTKYSRPCATAPGIRAFCAINAERKYSRTRL